ncbi:MAG TPA: response regulator transcription factor [Nitratifractor sp.]|jgi:DNA-binding response OmpR family regulator|nr:response regulator transcription factor [Nitratifractor sp.]HHH20584.1 response regulator transcription factor [Nitratifractor sp.]
MKILVVEDDENIVSVMKKWLKEAHHTVDVATNGADGEYLAETNSYDAIILDWMLPEKDGIEVLESLRMQEIKTPVIMLTAKSDIDDRVKGLRGGADDYLTKPFSFRELLARLEVLQRRAVANGSNIVTVEDIVIDIDKRSVSKNGEEIVLTSQEYEILLYLLKHRNSYVSKFMLEEHLWSNEEYRSSNVLQVAIYNLRKKLGKSIIKSFRGLGYKIES